VLFAGKMLALRAKSAPRGATTETKSASCAGVTRIEALEYLAAMQETAFWEDIDLSGLEDLRLRLRQLMAFLDKKKRKIVYADFEDEITGVRVGEPSHMPRMTGAQYQKKVE